MFRRLSFSLFTLASFACSVEPQPTHRRQPLVAHRAPLNVLFLVDASGSMEEPIDPHAPECTGCGAGQPCPNGCVTRWSLARDLVTTVSLRALGQAVIGLSLFPRSPSCDAPTGLDEAFSTAPSLRALHERAPGGGTPTAAALRLATSLAQLRDPSADNVVVLVTDGLPNCNPSHPANACGVAATHCQCTLANCNSPSFCSLGCLDDDQTLEAARSLGQQGIQLVTVTLGPEWVTPGGLSLAGELGAVDVSSSACGVNCQSLVLRVLSAADEWQARQQLETRLGGCAWNIDGPAPAALDVEVDGLPLAPDDYIVTGQRVWLDAAPCERVRSGEPLAIFSR